MRTIAEAYIQVVPLRNIEELHDFRSFLKEVRELIIDAEEISSLRITVRCKSLKILENLWQDYISGALNEAAQRYLVTDKVLDLYNLRELKLSTKIDEEEYRRYKAQLTEIEGKQRERERERENFI